MDRLKEYVIKHSSCSMPRCEYVENDIEIDCDKCQEIMLKEHDAKVRADAIDEELQEFAQWLWDSHYLVDEAFTIRLVEQYKTDKRKKKSKEANF